MRILLVAETLTLGGAELFALRMANALQKHAMVGLVIFYENRIDPGLRAELAPGVELIVLSSRWTRLFQKIDSALFKVGVDYSYTHFTLVRKLRRIFSHFRPDVVHGNLWKTDWVIARAKRGATFLHVSTSHGDYRAFYEGNSVTWLLNVRRKIEKTVSQIDVIVCLNQEQFDFYSNSFPSVLSKLNVIYNGYRPLRISPSKTRMELGLPHTGFIFGMVGRGIEAKGWKQAIGAFQKANIPGSFLVLVGSGDYLDLLARSVVDRRIIFIGPTPTPLQYIEHFDVGMLPTLFEHESLPTVVIEYLYCGKPVIATDIAEIRKMITDDSNGGEAGSLISRHDLLKDDDALALVMAKMVTDTKYRTDKRSFASGAFAKFEMDKCVQAYLELYAKRS